MGTASPFITRDRLHVKTKLIQIRLLTFHQTLLYIGVSSEVIKEKQLALKKRDYDTIGISTVCSI